MGANAALSMPTVFAWMIRLAARHIASPEFNKSESEPAAGPPAAVPTTAARRGLTAGNVRGAPENANDGEI